MDFSISDLNLQLDGLPPINFNSIETLPGFEARAESLSTPRQYSARTWILSLLALIEKDETLTTCQCFNAEVCYGSGLQYCATEASALVKSAVDDFLLDNDLAAYFLGICQDFKHFGFTDSVLILNEDGSRIVRLLRKKPVIVASPRLTSTVVFPKSFTPTGANQYPLAPILRKSTCLFANIFTFSRTFATMLVMEKFSDCLEYISSINIHEQEY